MMEPDQTAALDARLQRLQSFVDLDPGNLRLLSEAAELASTLGNDAALTDLLHRYEVIEPLPAGLLNLRAVQAMKTGAYDGAAEILRDLLADHPGDPSLRFNLAWCHAGMGDYEPVDLLIDDTVAAAAPKAAALKVQALHHLGRLGEALAFGARLSAARPDDIDLAAALSVVALDAEQADLAARYAALAGDTHEGLSTLGMLALGSDQLDEALEYFERSLQARPDSARGLVGKGLSLLVAERRDEAASCLDEGARQFGDHLGSWIAAGWAYFVKGDLATSRARFEHALALDDTFAESHGGLAVLDAVEGNLEGARRRADIALRLDRTCLSGALARSLLLAAEGDQASAERVRNIALNTPMGPGGRTLAAAMVGLAQSTGRHRP
jgi:tetratricopeptide (TPR) repeat protein